MLLVRPSDWNSKDNGHSQVTHHHPHLLCLIKGYPLKVGITQFSSIRVTHGPIQRCVLERHKEINSEIIADFISLPLSERKGRSSPVHASVHRNPKYLSLWFPFWVWPGCISWKDNLSVSNPLTFNLLKRFGPELFESQKALWVYFTRLLKVSFLWTKKFYFASSGLTKTSKKVKLLLNSGLKCLSLF